MTLGKWIRRQFVFGGELLIIDNAGLLLIEEIACIFPFNFPMHFNGKR